MYNDIALLYTISWFWYYIWYVICSFKFETKWVSFKNHLDNLLKTTNIEF